MIKPYSKKANPVKLEKLDAADLAGCNTATISDTRPQSEIQSMFESLDKQVLSLCRRMSCLEMSLKPVLRSHDSEVDEITSWEDITKPVETDNTVTLVGNQLESQCIRLSLIIYGVNSIIDRLGV